jgi:ABC-type transporter Mla maintaining outer membrane lipid asymmetry permease subunit MlaE
MAIAMLSADLLHRLEISGKVLELVEKEVKPLIQLLTGEEPNTFQMMGIRFKVQSMLHQTVPPAKATLYAIGLTKLFVLEVGPLLTALLLCGRIGGAYAGRVGTMVATNQNKLLTTLGVNPRSWTLWPSLLAAMVAAPILTVSGTSIALYLGGLVGPTYGIGTTEQYIKDVFDSLLPVLRIRCLEGLWDSDGMNHENPTGSSSVLMRIVAMLWHTLSEGNFDFSVTYTKSPRWVDTWIELMTYPPIYHLLKAKVFIVIIMTVAEVVARSQPNLTPRGVPAVITLSVVMAGLLVILADWGFSQLWLLRN